MFCRFLQGFCRRTAALAVVLLLFTLLTAGADGGTSVLLTFTGDCTIGGEDRLQFKDYSFHGYVKRYGYGYPFANVQDYFEQDDLTVINLENVLYDSEDGRASKTFNFRGPTDFVRVLQEGSVELAYLGNNHTLDYGPPGMRSTVGALESHGIGWFGSSQAVTGTHIFEKDGVKVGFAGAYAPYWHTGQEELAQVFLGLQEAGCSAIVGVIHAGAEYSPYRDKRQQSMAAWMVEHGASVVIGHHPHVIQGVDVIGDASVVYSLGNFAFGGNKDLKATLALLARVELRFDGKGEYLGHQLNLVPVGPSGTLEYNNYQPVFLSGRDALKAMALAQRDTAFPLDPFREGVGALQPFIPALPEQPAGDAAVESE